MTDNGEERIFQKIRAIISSELDFQICQESSISKLQFPKLDIDLIRQSVLSDGVEVNLTDLQYRLLIYLAEQPGRVFTYEQIYEAVWREPYAYEKGNIMAQVSLIRRKIEPDNSYPRYIDNVRNVGYRFNKISNDS